MKRFISVLSATSMGIFLATGSLWAGDYNSGIVSKTPGESFTHVEYGSGWYLRGDISYSFNGDMDVSFSRAARAGDANATAGDTYSAGVGFGYIFNDYFRSDITLDYFGDRSWSGSATGCGLDGLGVPYTGDCSSSDRGNFEAHAANLNAYVNLGTFGRLSPYVGGGVGLAHVSYSSTNSNLVCVVDPGEDCDLGTHSGGSADPETFTGTQSFAGGQSVNFIYSLTAGLDYKIDEYWTADLNYRYSNITSGEVYSDGAGDTVAFDGAQIHEIRAGLRYEIW